MTIPQASLVFSILAIANGTAFAGEAYIRQPIWTGPQKAVANASLEKVLASPIKLNDVKTGIESHPQMNGNTSYVSQNGSANLAVVSQNGGGNVSLVSQQGSLNRAIVTQQGNAR